MLVYYKFYYIDPINWYVTNEVIQYSFIILLKCHLIATLNCKIFVVKFVISVWKMKKLMQILGKKSYKLM